MSAENIKHLLKNIERAIEISKKLKIGEHAIYWLK